MKKYLVISHPAVGHIHSVMPIIKVLQERGDDVRLISGKIPPGVVGMTAGMSEERFIRTVRGLGSIRELFTPRKGFDQLKSVHTLSAPLLDAAISLIGEGDWFPDTVIGEPTQCASNIISDMFHIPHVTMGWGTHFGMYTCADDLMIDLMPERWKAHGSYTHPNFVRCSTQPFDWGESLNLPSYIHALPARPTINVTMGSLTEDSGKITEQIEKALDGLDINVVPSGFGDKVRYLPHTRMLPRCDAIIFQGGFNTLYSAMWHGIPMIVFPQESADQHVNAERVMALGLGLAIEDVRTVRDAVEVLLHEDSFRENCQQMRNDIHGLPTLATLMDGALGLNRYDIEISETNDIPLSASTGK